MTNNELLASSLEKEWQSLHHSYESSEAQALLIKLTALLVCLFGFYLQLYFVSALLTLNVNQLVAFFGFNN